MEIEYKKVQDMNTEWTEIENKTEIREEDFKGHWYYAFNIGYVKPDNSNTCYENGLIIAENMRDALVKLEKHYGDIRHVSYLKAINAETIIEYKDLADLMDDEEWID